MASITKRLLKRNSSNKQLLVFVIRNSMSWRLDYSSGIRLETQLWTEHLHVKQEFAEYKELNKAIDALESSILAYASRILVSDPPASPKLVKEKLDEYLNRQTKKPVKKGELSVGFYEFFEQFITESGTTKTEGTLKTYTRTYWDLICMKPILAAAIAILCSKIKKDKDYSQQDNWVSREISTLLREDILVSDSVELP